MKNETIEEMKTRIRKEVDKMITDIENNLKKQEKEKAYV